MSTTQNKMPSRDPDWLEIVRQQVASLRYGVVEIVVHDARVTQIQKTERMRLDKPAPTNSENENE